MEGEQSPNICQDHGVGQRHDPVIRSRAEPEGGALVPRCGTPGGATSLLPRSGIRPRAGEDAPTAPTSRGGPPLWLSGEHKAIPAASVSELSSAQFLRTLIIPSEHRVIQASQTISLGLLVSGDSRTER